MSDNRVGPQMTPSDRLLVAQTLLGKNNNGVLKKGVAKELATSFGVSSRTIRAIWQSTKKQIQEGHPIAFPAKIKRSACSRAVTLDTEAMKAIPFSKRGSIRRLAKELEVSKSLVGRWVKSGDIKAHTNVVKPQLIDSNKLQRLKFSLSFLPKDSNTQKIRYDGMHNMIHIDEKWFYLQKSSERAYKLAVEEDPYRPCKSKGFIPKVMFMCTVARPQYSSEGELLFDGKIGMFPFTTLQPALGNSANRARGTLVTKPIESITKEVIKDCLLDKILPTIKAKWPAHASKHIIIQQDNARPHISNFDPDFRLAASSNGFDIQLICQPPNSPDTNVLDLGYFRAIQSLQTETRSYNVEDLVCNVLKSYEELETFKLNNVFLSLQACLIEAMNVQGGNNYRQPHIAKGAQVGTGSLPNSLDVEEQLVRDSIEYLDAHDSAAGTYDILGLMTDLGYL